jgi:hypothetical protein
MPNTHQVTSTRRNTHEDITPFLADGTPEDGVACAQCGAVYHHHRWTLRTEAKGKPKPSAHRVLCPGCRKIQGKDPGGVVTLSGGYWKIHREEITNLIRNEEKKAMGVNPVERIMEMEEENGHLVILTTNEKLAQRLGRAIHKACAGEVEYKWSADTKLARVEWNREA